MENSPPSEPSPPTSAGEPPQAPSSGRLKDPGSRGLAALSWLAIIGVVGLIVLSHALFATPDAVEVSEEPSSTSSVFTLMARYAVGTSKALDNLAPGSDAQTQETTDQLLKQLSDMAVSHDDHLRLALIAIDLERPELFETHLERAVTPPDADEPDAAGADEADDLEASEDAIAETRRIPEYVLRDAARIRALQESGREALSPEDVQTLQDHHGWFAELALTHGADPNSAARRAAVTPAVRVMYAFLTIAALAVAGGVVGLVLLIVLLIRLATGKLRLRYARPAPGGSVYIETFALFLVAFIGVELVSQLVYSLAAIDVSYGLRWLLLLILLWPMFRGATRTQTKYALGWHRGEGFVKETGAGIVGYLAGLPVVGVGLLATLTLSAIMTRFSEGPAPPPTHPIVQDAGTSSLWGIVSLYLLASVWAPVVEESMFRGALFHHLRGVMGALASALLVGFIFAIIHPQGILLVPPLMALGFNFAMIREWRGSLIGPMVAHGLHNAVLVTMLIVAMS